MTNPHYDPEIDPQHDTPTDRPKAAEDMTTPVDGETASPPFGDLKPEDLRLVAAPSHHHHRHSDIIDPAQEPLLLAPSHRHRRRKKAWWRTLLKVLLILFLILLSIALVATTTFLVLREIGRQELLRMDHVVLTAPQSLQQNAQVVIDDNGRTVTYNGETYRFNENRTNILCIGIDKNDMGLVNGVVGTGGQADALILLSIDTVTGEIDAIAISRDSLVDIELYTADGTFYGVENTQICLSYAYGDGREISCENTVDAATRLLYGIPINTYFAVDLGAIPILNDAIGGVEVVSLYDFPRSDGSMCHAGDRILLRGAEAERYVRERDVELLDSNNDRMERQKQYITAFFETALAATSNDLGVPLDLFNAVSANSTTTLNASRISFLASTLVEKNGSLEFHSIPGHIAQGDDKYAEFIVNETALYEQILSIFYTKV